MAFNDALSDMLARIKNAHKARKSFTSCYKSKLNLNVLNVLTCLLQAERKINWNGKIKFSSKKSQ